MNVNCLRLTPLRLEMKTLVAALIPVVYLFSSCSKQLAYDPVVRLAGMVIMSDSGTGLSLLQSSSNKYDLSLLTETTNLWYVHAVSKACNNILYFDAQTHNGSHVYRAVIGRDPQSEHFITLDKVVAGHRPCISPDGTHLLYKPTLSSNCLHLVDLSTGNNRLIATNASDCYSKCCWLDSNLFAYCSVNSELTLCQASTGHAVSPLRSRSIPCAISPNGEMMILLDGTMTHVSVYYPRTGKVVPLLDLRDQVASEGFIWNLDNNGFLYSRSRILRGSEVFSLENQLMRRERRSLYFNDMKGNEVLIIDRFTLCDGVWLASEHGVSAEAGH